MKPWIPLAPLLLALACASPPLGSDDEVLVADLERIEAMIAADPARLEAILHPLLTYTHSNGLIDTRDSLVESLVAARVDYRAIAPLDPSVRVLGDTAVITTRAQLEVAAGGQVLDLDSVYTAVYQREAGGWRLVAYHSSPRKP